LRGELAGHHRPAKLAGEAVFALLKQYRELVVTLVLLALPLATYLSHAKHGRELNRFDRWVLTATGPLERGLDAAVFAAEDAWGEYVARGDVYRQNRELRARVLHLEAQTLSLEEARLENERLRQLLDLPRAATEAPLVARVVGTGLAPNFLSVRISRGENDGVRKGMAVVAATGVVGKVQQTFASYADVQLITDVNSGIAAEDQKTRARSTVRGGGENKRCKLDYTERSALFDDGDLLVTSGTDGVFPKGLAVGRVTHLDRRKTGMSLSGEVEPAVELTTVEEVLVLTSAPVGRDAQPPSAAIDGNMKLLKAGMAQ
jgi:rod shape-determining protein MreC